MGEEKTKQKKSVFVKKNQKTKNKQENKQEKQIKQNVQHLLHHCGYGNIFVIY